MFKRKSISIDSFARKMAIESFAQWKEEGASLLVFKKEFTNIDTFKIWFVYHSTSWIIASQRISPNVLEDLMLFNQKFQEELASIYIEEFGDLEFGDFKALTSTILSAVNKFNEPRAEVSSMADDLKIGRIISSSVGIDYDPFLATALTVANTKTVIANMKLLEAFVSTL